MKVIIVFLLIFLVELIHSATVSPTIYTALKKLKVVNKSQLPFNATLNYTTGTNQTVVVKSGKTKKFQAPKNNYIYAFNVTNPGSTLGFSTSGPDRVLLNHKYEIRINKKL
jgi:hypothetical protein